MPPDTFTHLLTQPPPRSSTRLLRSRALHPRREREQEQRRKRRTRGSSPPPSVQFSMARPVQLSMAVDRVSGSLSSKTSLGFVLGAIWSNAGAGELSSSQRERPGHREASSFHWWSLVRLWHLVGPPGTTSPFPLLTPHKAGSSMYGYGDFDGPGLHALVDEMVRRTGASLPFGATLRGSPAGAGGGLCPL